MKRDNTMKVPLFKPAIGKEELNALAKIFKTGWIGLGPNTAKFEKQFADYIGSKVAIGTNSATSALDLALKIFDFKEGEVLVPTITFVATAHVVEYNPQLSVKFVDVDETLCIDVNDLKSKLSDKTRAVIPVHVGGQACKMDEIVKIVKEYNNEVKIIEDCANTAGGEYKGKMLGTWGDIGCFSFEAKKNITTGDGGMIVTDNEDLYEPLKRMRWVGMDKDTWKRFSSDSSYSWYYEINELGYKYNMNDIAATIGIEQLKKLEVINKRKREIMKSYSKGLQDIQWLNVPAYYDLEAGGYWLYIIQVDERDRFFNYLSDNNITAGVHFMPIHLHPYYKKKYNATLPKAEKIWKNIVSMPLFYDMTNKMIDYVIDITRKFK